MWRAIDTLRLYALVLTAPATVLWARALGPATGALLITTHAAIVVFASAWSARCDEAEGLAPRLRWAGPLGRAHAGAVEIGVPVGFAMALILTCSLIVANVWVGIGAALALVGAAWLGGLPRRDRLARVELVGPVGLLAGPGLLFRLHAWEPPAGVAALDEAAPAPAEMATLAGRVVRPEVIPGPALAATLLAAAVLLVAILLCLIRDRSADELDGLRTTVTRIGRAGGVALAWAWMLAVALWCVIGVGAGWWAWPAAAAGSWTVAAAGACLTAHRDDLAVGVWWVGATVAAVWAMATV
ncbi:MAG: hypothetical protein D6693_02215 [Planctomycetota bacterium]|nr:MAG: hypothetical protein D6693_02215 [Planctomycetota bacterium]